jgi:nickel-dependent lactate racemase
MNLTLDYGKADLPVTLPDENVAHVLGLSPAPPLADPAGAVRAALAAPVGTSPLSEIARGRRDACIVVCDITRPVPNAVVLPPVLEALAAGGVPAERVTILIATGTHRPNEGDELVEMLGPAVLASGVTVVNHVCTDPATNRHLGVTPRGVPVALDTRYLDADLKITCGLIEPHFMAGYSGGRKMVMPGIAALETVQAWHSPRFLEHPNATNGVVDGNPVHDENTHIAGLCPPDLICDVTLDEKRRMTGVFAGDMVGAWRAGVAFVASQVRAAIPEPVDIAVTSGGGWPLDATYYQAVKGMVGAAAIVRRGGHIIIGSECSEGVGGPHFRDTLLEWRDLQELVRQMQAPDWRYVPDQWQIEELAKATRDHTVWCVASPAAIPHELMARLHARPAPSVEAAVAGALAELGAASRIAVIPKGPYVIPCLVSEYAV